MQELKITGETETFTAISNIFIDHYMDESNGEFVKLYLYLVRLSSAGKPVSVQILADLLHCTDKDVCRGIKYWVSKGVISLTYSDRNKKVADGIELRRLRVPRTEPAEVILLAGEGSETGIREDASSDEANAEATDSEANPAENSAAATLAPEKTKLTPKMIRELTRDEELENLRHEAEAYFNHMLTPGEINTLHYILREMAFSFDLCEFLLEYTASIGKTSFRYIEAVARKWYEEEITTRDAAESFVLNYNTLYYAVQRELGLSAAGVTPVTKSYVDKWSGEYGFTKEIILEACRRTVQKNAGRPLEYADGILRDWHRSGIRRFSDIAKQDAGHKAARMQKQSAKSVSTGKEASSPFPQTDMTQQMKEIEDLYLHMAN